MSIRDSGVALGGLILGNCGFASTFLADSLAGFILAVAAVLVEYVESTCYLLELGVYRGKLGIKFLLATR